MDEIKENEREDFLGEYRSKLVAQVVATERRIESMKRSSEWWKESPDKPFNEIRRDDFSRYDRFEPLIFVERQYKNGKLIIDLTHSAYHVESALLAIDSETLNCFGYSDPRDVEYVDPKNILGLLKKHVARFPIKEILSMQMQQVRRCCEKQSSEMVIDKLLEKAFQNCPDEIKNSKYNWYYEMDGSVFVLTIRQGKPNAENRSSKEHSCEI